MAETVDLTEKQLSVISSLAAGKTYKQTSQDVGVSIKTIQRWNAQEEFKGELQRRRNRAAAQHQKQSAAIEEAEISSFYEDLKAYREARLSIYRAKLARGTKILKRVGERFDDLPDEAIAPQQLTGLFAIADQLCEAGLNGWAELLALDELLKRLENHAS